MSAFVRRVADGGTNSGRELFTNLALRDRAALSNAPESSWESRTYRVALLFIVLFVVFRAFPS